MLCAAILADDLTGAADCAAAFAGGRPAFVALGPAAVPEARVVAWDLDSRSEAQEVAAGRAEAATVRAISRGAQVLYKKIDSTLRGHVGAEVAAVFRAATRAGDGALVVAAPAFPAQGRTMSGGRVRISGAPLESSPAAGDAARSDDLAILLAGAGLRTVRAGVAALRSSGLDTRAEAVVCDAESDDDLRRIADLGAALPGRVIWVGSGGLARYLPAAVGLCATGRAAERAPASRLEEDLAAGRRRPRLEPRRGPLLFLVGSRSLPARAQAETLAAEIGVERFELDPGTLLAGERSAGWAAAGAGPSGALGEGRDALLVLGQRVQIGAGAERSLAAALGRLAAPLCDHADGLIATGGDTARGVLDALGATGLHLEGEVEPGVPLAFLEPRRGLAVVTKAGGFGDSKALSRCRATLKGGRS